MRTICKAIVICLLGTGWHVLSLSRSAVAEGALAVGVTENLREGSTYGFAFDMKTSELARTHAMARCQSVRAATARLKAKCRIVKTFKRQCLAIALTPKAPGFGWAVEPDLATAEQRAIGTCQEAAGKKGELCTVSESACDTQEKN
jgi:hypothetical protein